jgi:hypothetical protein
MKYLYCIFIFFNSCFLTFDYANGQVNKSGNTFIFGNQCLRATFGDTINPPSISKLFPLQGNPYFGAGHSNISDSATGKLLMACSGYVLFDTTGNVMKNGDSLVPSKMYSYYTPPFSIVTQCSLILPKGSNGLYYLFTPVETDSQRNYFDLNNLPIQEFNLLQYHIIDMNANNGLGAVVQKNIPLLQNVLLSKTGMMACRHANGYDWWLLKQGAWKNNTIYSILVTADTLIVKDTQVINKPDYIDTYLDGQSAFSANGKKYAYAMGRNSQLFLADFNRCNGKLTNHNVINIPIDSTTHPGDALQNRLDSNITGVCFSANDSFIYITRTWNIYQYELYNTDSASAWYRVQHGPDTILNYAEYYARPFRGIDNRIYLGKQGGGIRRTPIIKYPNKKGSACGYCPACYGYSGTGITVYTSPSNMPDFNLGVDSSCYWPLSIEPAIEPLMSNEALVYPNPCSGQITIKYNFTSNGTFYIYDATGKQVDKVFLDNQNNSQKFDITNIANGIYIYKIITNKNKQTLGKLTIFH